MKKTRLFFKSFYLSSLILFCLTIGLTGIGKAYENTRQIGFGEYKRAIELTDDGIRILDFEIKI